jgi:hypothetical protein
VENRIMSSRLDPTVDRRQFLQTAVGALAAARVAFPFDAAAQAGEDPANTHNMLVVGEQTAFLSHLPMFDGLDKAKTAFRSPHRYQLILEAAFSSQGKDVTDVYFKDRRANPGTRIYTLSPDEFVITRAFTPREKPLVTAFNATVFRGHLENGGRPLPELQKTSVSLTRVVHGRMFDPLAKKPAELEYILFGKGTELFLAHAIFAPPDFDHCLSVKLSGAELTAKDFAQDIRVVVPARKNVAAERLREKQRVDATLRIGPAGSPAKVQLEAGAEFYFEEGELLVPPTFAPTAEEKKK